MTDIVFYNASDYLSLRIKHFYAISMFSSSQTETNLALKAYMDTCNKLTCYLFICSYPYRISKRKTSLFEIVSYLLVRQFVLR